MKKALYDIGFILLIFICSCSPTENNYLFDEKGNKYEIEMNNGIPSGKVKTYYSSGQLMSVMEYDYDKEKGSYISFYKNGAKQAKGELKNELMVGKWVFYYRNGSIYKIIKIEKGKPYKDVLKNIESKIIDGKYTFFDSLTGIKIKEYTIKNADIDGLYKKYNSTTGVLIIKQYYKNGEMEGKDMLFFDNGKVHQIVERHNSEAIKGLAIDSAGQVNIVVNVEGLLSREDSVMLDRDYPDWKEQIEKFMLKKNNHVLQNEKPV